MLEARSTLMRILFLVSLFAATTAAAEGQIARFDGDTSTQTAVFHATGPWMLDWSTHSDNSLPKTFELRLYNADSGAFEGKVVELRELGSSRRLFETPGSYQVEVVAENLQWTLIVSKVGDAEAGRMKRRSEGTSTIEDTAKKYARQVSEDSFASWRPVDDQTLLLFEQDDSRGYRVTFAHPCEGLSQATALMFVASSYGSGGEIYDAIMLDSGAHCSFERVIPTVFD